MHISNPLIVLDLETTGTWIEKDRIIEIAMIKCFPDGSIKEYSRRINPQINIPPVVSQLTGITDADVHEAPVFKDVASDVLEFLNNADLAGFNVERFDLPLLERELNECGRDFHWRERNIYDVQKVFHLNEKRDLTAAYQFYCEKELTQAHSAIVDAQATLEILREQVHRYGDDDMDIEALKKFKYVQMDFFHDSEGKFRWWNGQLYMMFGKYAKKNTLQEIVRKDSKYLQWILSANFSGEIKDIVEDALNGKFPHPPEQNL